MVGSAHSSKRTQGLEATPLVPTVIAAPAEPEMTMEVTVA